MSAELLREAAAKMRERAEAATPGPWVHIPDSACGVGTLGGSMTSDYDAHVYMGNQHTAEDAEHIASWHPAVALAVADWIDGHARDLASSGGHLSSCDSPGDVEHALDVARAYLGTTTDSPTVA